VDWPARLHKLEKGKLPALLPAGWELWLDGGHNDSAGEVLAEQALAWKKQDGRPLHLILGMIRTKNPAEFLTPLAPYVSSLQTVAIPDEEISLTGPELLNLTNAAGIKAAGCATSVEEAIQEIVGMNSAAARVLICGSLYLAGNVLKRNGQ
jgi:dihydrofolate synthase/folylpolyglutamate synthase